MQPDSFCFLILKDIARLKVPGKGLPTRKKDKGVFIATEVAPPRSTRLKNMDVYSTHLTIHNFYNDDDVGSRTQIHNSVSADE